MMSGSCSAAICPLKVYRLWPTISRLGCLQWSAERVQLDGYHGLIHHVPGHDPLHHPDTHHRSAAWTAPTARATRRAVDSDQLPRPPNLSIITTTASRPNFAHSRTGVAPQFSLTLSTQSNRFPGSPVELYGPVIPPGIAHCAERQLDDRQR